MLISVHNVNFLEIFGDRKQTNCDAYMYVDCYTLHDAKSWHGLLSKRNMITLEKKQTLNSAVHHVPNMNIIIDKYRE